MAKITAILIAAVMLISLVSLYTSIKINNKLDDLTGKIIAEPSLNDAAEDETGQLPAVEISADDDPVKGQKNAKVTIVEFSDFQCPYCASFHQQVFSQIMENYIKVGKVNFIYRDFPLPFHANARAAAIAADCAGEQGKYWEYHNIIFQNQDKLDASFLIDYASRIGIDSLKFSKCIEENDGADIDLDIADGKRFGVTGTPMFFVNGREIEGSQPFSAFAQIIDEELSK